VSAAFESLTGLALLHPWLTLLAALVPVALAIRLWRGAPTVLFAPATFLSAPDASDAALPRSWRARLVPLPRVLQVLALLLVVLAVARPVERVPLPPQTEGIDILLCLDTSSSMDADDMDARRTRLEVARDAAAQFVADRKDDRIGLLCFARYPDVRCPLTLDHAALTTFLSEVTTVDGDGPEDATGIGTAVARAAQVLHGSVAPSKVVILLTDGEENVSTATEPGEIAPLHAAQLCEKLGVRVYTIAAGVDGDDAGGARAPIDTRQVEQLSERTGGAFFTARDAAAVEGVYASIDRLETVELAEPRHRLEERFLPFLLAAAGFLLVGRLLESTVLEVLP
jgi:Ca-activated chloride channel family protein